MIKRIIFSFLMCVVIIFSFSSCVMSTVPHSFGKGEQSTTTEVFKLTERETEVKVTETEESSLVTLSVTESNTQWIDAYKNYLLELIEQDEQDKDEADSSVLRDTFSLIYLDNDENPELVVSSGIGKGNTETLITFYNGKLLSFPDLGYYGWFQYREGQGTVLEEYSRKGDSNSTVWKLTNGSLQCIWNGWATNLMLEDDGEPEYHITDTKTVEAYIESPTELNLKKWLESGIKVSEAEYKAAYNANVPSGLRNTREDGNLIGSITKENVAAYFEALAKKDSILRLYYDEITFSGTITEKQTDYHGNAYYDFQLDRPVIVQFEGEEFPPLLTVIRISESDFDDWNLTTGHTVLQGRPARDQEEPLLFWLDWIES